MIVRASNPIITPTCPKCGWLRREYARMNRRRLGIWGLHRLCCCGGCVLPDPTDTLTMTIEDFAACSGCMSSAGWSGGGGGPYEIINAPDINGAYQLSYVTDSGGLRTFRTTIPDIGLVLQRYQGTTIGQCIPEEALEIQDSFDLLLQVQFSIATACIASIFVQFLPNPSYSQGIHTAALLLRGSNHYMLGVTYSDEPSRVCGQLYPTSGTPSLFIGKLSDTINVTVEVDK